MTRLMMPATQAAAAMFIRFSGLAHDTLAHAVGYNKNNQS